MQPTEMISTDGYTYFSIYRNHAIYTNRNAEKYTYGAGRDGQITIFDVSFAKIQEQLDKITGAGE